MTGDKFDKFNREESQFFANHKDQKGYKNYFDLFFQ